MSLTLTKPQASKIRLALREAHDLLTKPEHRAMQTKIDAAMKLLETKRPSRHLSGSVG